MTEVRHRVGRERDVDAVLDQLAIELLGLELFRLDLDRSLELLAGLVGRLAGGGALLRRKAGHAAQQVGELGFAAEILDPDVLQLLGRLGPGDGLLRVAQYLFDPLGHGCGAILVSS
jgi:hypothetical protein